MRLLKLFFFFTRDVLKNEFGNLVAFVPQLSISYETHFRQENGLLRVLKLNQFLAIKYM